MHAKGQLAVSAAIALMLFAGCKSAPKQTVQPQVIAPKVEVAAPKKTLFSLTANNFWRIELPLSKRFDASGLVWAEGKLLIVADREPAAFELEFSETNVARLRKTEVFSWPQLQPYIAEKRGRFDLEGLARDERGRIYACEEANRWILRWDRMTKQVERLDVDWSPVKQYFSANQNASFEGIAVGHGKLWLANERERARVIEVDLESLKVVGDFAPQPSTWGLFLHYSDICFFKGRLFLLARHHYLILEIDPTTREIVAEYDYRAVENAPERLYLKAYPTGVMEGLAVDENYFWLVTDNNGMGLAQNSEDRRPTLFKCPRPKS